MGGRLSHDQFPRGFNAEAVVRTAELILGWMLVVAHSLGAQTPSADQIRSRFDVAAGVTFNLPKDVNQRPLCTELGLPCLSPRTFPDFGLMVQAAAYATQHLALVAEAGTYANRWDTVSTTSIADRRENHIGALLAGPRLVTGLIHLTSLFPLASKDDHGFCAFAQLLVGEERSTVAPTRFAFQPGAGIDFRLSNPSMWIRVTGDYRSTRGGPRNLSTGRTMAGLVVRP